MCPKDIEESDNTRLVGLQRMPVFNCRWSHENYTRLFAPDEGENVSERIVSSEWEYGNNWYTFGLDG